MTDYEINPFQVLYVTDAPDPRAFVDLFSDFPIQHAQALFREGNVVLRGTQGSGKSMLLNLLRPEIRLAYSQAKASFPVPDQLSSFLGAGINLTHSGILDIGQRPVSTDHDREDALFPLYFADFLNYYTVRDILRSVDTMGRDAGAFDNLVNADVLDVFAQDLAGQECWFGFLSDCGSFQALCNRIDERISCYKAFHQYNKKWDAGLSEEIRQSTTAVGEPIARTEERLKKAGVIGQSTPVFVCIDQIERLSQSDIVRPELGTQYRRIINKALGRRDSRVSYCIGTRTYAWDDELTMFGTGDKLENLRDYRIIDLDEMLRREEDRKTWIFPQFAEDVFIRRLRHAGHKALPEDDVIGAVFGHRRTLNDALDMARQYVKKSSAKRVLKLDESWPEDWRTFLQSLYDKNPVEACLATAWAQQRGGPGRTVDRRKASPPTEKRPWNEDYWKKDRVRLSLFQIAVRTVQRYKWAGKESILALSSGNISVFVSICHEIWDAFLRSERRKASENRTNVINEGIERAVQAVGIQTASAVWHDKITELPGGHDRQSFVDEIGSVFRKRLLDDVAMSYPGHNGFSLANADLDAHPAIRRFLREAVGYGNLYETQHTTRTGDRGQRTKWYLMPILSDLFQIPEVHPREPYYVKIEHVIGWLKRANVILKDVDYSLAEIDPKSKQPEKKSKHPKKVKRLPLFDGLEEE